MKQIPIVMPQMGQSVAEGTIIRWIKKAGDPVRIDETLLEVETDKTTVEVESPVSGVLTSCLKGAGEIAAAGEVIGMLEAESAPEDAPAALGGGQREPARAAPPPAPEGGLANIRLPDVDRDRFSPYVLRLAMFNNLSLNELESVTGTGRNGRVTKTDLLQYLARRPISPTTMEGLAGKEALSNQDLAALGKVVPMTSLRRTIADHMVQSIHTSAHVTMVHFVDVTHVVSLRDRIKQQFLEKYQARLTYTGVLLFVTSRVLRQFPTINASVYDKQLILRNEINIGCAVALQDESLVVPVVRNADRRTFPEIATELDRLIGLARNKQLTRADVEGGTFTISNFGAFGSTIGTPIINQPQVAILGMGTVEKTPVVVDQQICIRDRLYLSFSFDHRVIDGAMGGRFLNAIQRATEALTEQDLNVSAL